MKTPNIIKHCPKDCLRNKTCHRGEPLPYNKRLCYTPPPEEVTFMGGKGKPDYFHFYKNMVTYSLELERELEEHKKLIDKIEELLRNAPVPPKEVPDKIMELIELGSKYV